MKYCPIGFHRNSGLSRRLWVTSEVLIFVSEISYIKLQHKCVGNYLTWWGQVCTMGTLPRKGAQILNPDLRYVMNCIICKLTTCHRVVLSIIKFKTSSAQLALSSDSIQKSNKSSLGVCVYRSHRGPFSQKTEAQQAQ